MATYEGQKNIHFFMQLNTSKISVMSCSMGDSIAVILGDCLKLFKIDHADKTELKLQLLLELMKHKFLEVLFDGSVNGVVTRFDQKPTFRILFVNWNSFSPKSWKTNLINILLRRTLIYLTCKRTAELDNMKRFLTTDDYPEDILESCIKRNLLNLGEACPVYSKLL